MYLKQYSETTLVLVSLIAPNTENRYLLERERASGWWKECTEAAETNRGACLSLGMQALPAPKPDIISHHKGLVQPHLNHPR